MSVTEVIAFLFKIINFAALIGLVLYLFQRKIKSQIKTKIREKEVFWQNLQINKQALIDQQHKLKLEIAWQKEYGNELLQKIASWEKTSFLSEQALIEETKMNAQRMAERTRIFYEKKYEHDLFEKVIPHVFKQARNDLQDQFAAEKNAQNYLFTILSYMKKSSS